MPKVITTIDDFYGPQLENVMRQQQIGMQPLKEALMGAQAQKAIQSVRDPLGLGSGDVGQAMQLQKIKDLYGANSPVYQDARRAFDAAIQGKEALTSYRGTMQQTANKRYATPLGKMQQEIAEVQAGFMPGTGGQQPLSPEEQQMMLNQYQANREKLISDSDTRKKASFAVNIDKTLESFDPNHLLQYSGPKGSIKLAQDKLKQNEAYKNYKMALTSAALLAKQIRQFYGDSITPGIQEAIGNIVNPSTWIDSPEIAQAQFNQLKSILRNETQTYKDALGAPRGQTPAKGINEAPKKKNVVSYKDYF